MIPDLLIITSPTASGKTSLSLELAKRFPIEIISADSRQVYKFMDIGTAKVNQKEQDIVKHHLIDIINPDENYSAGKFENDAKEIINGILDRNKIPIVVGGTGFYIKSLIYGLEEDNISNEKKDEVRTYINEILDNGGPEKLKELLKSEDKDAYVHYEGQNIRRLSRALEFFLINGYSITKQEFHSNLNYNPKYFIIDIARDKLYNNINTRTIEMWENGFEDEVRELLKMGYGLHNPSLNSVGYRECIEYINGNLIKKSAINEMQKFTRHFAKRQLTWIKNQIEEDNKICLNKDKLLDKLCIDCEKYLKNIS